MATLVNQIRAERRGRATLVLDAGDTIQGTPLATYYAKQEPITTTGETHPMARAMNVIDYDAVTLGNHEFNYGLPLLATWIDAAGLPGAGRQRGQRQDRQAGLPAVRHQEGRARRAGAPTLRGGHPRPDQPRRGHLGQGQRRGQAALRRHGRDRREVGAGHARAAAPTWSLISAHGGDSGTSSYGPELPNENPAALIAQQVPGIDAILFGHAHNEVVERFVTNNATGEQVLLSEPSKWGQRLTRMDFTLTRERGRWTVTGKARHHAQHQHRGRGPAGARRRARRSTPRPSRTSTRWSRQSTEELSAAESRYKDTPILDYINKVQTDMVTAALAGGQYAALPVLSIAAPFSRTAVFPAGDVQIKDVAGLYIYDNTLEAVVLTGAEVKAYLEYSAKYFITLAGRRAGRPGDDQRPGACRTTTTTCSPASTTTSTSARPVGQRITRLVLPGTDTPVAADAAVRRRGEQLPAQRRRQLPRHRRRPRSTTRSRRSASC